VLILLPPSEGKTAPESGPPVDLDALAYPQLAKQRERLLRVVVNVSGTAPKRALERLGLSAGQGGELERNRALADAPAGPAARVYSGVLYERLRLAELPAAARERVLIASALWGVVRPDDRIPAYRLSIGADLPRVGPLAAYWRPALRKALPDDGLVIDMRSGPYAAAWKPRAADVVEVRAFTEQDGRRTVVSHMVKATRGDVARVLLEAAAPPAAPDAVADLVAASGREVELVRGRAGWTLDVIER